jgi:hypothetical protein
MTPVQILKGTYRWNDTLTRIPTDDVWGLDFTSELVDGDVTTKFTFNRLRNQGNYIQFYVTNSENVATYSLNDTYIDVYNLSTNTWEWELQDFTVLYPVTYDETFGNWFNNNVTAISVEPEPEEPDEPDTPAETNTIKKGTYRFNDVLVFPVEKFEGGASLEFLLPDIYADNAINVYGHQIGIAGEGGYGQMGYNITTSADPDIYGLLIYDSKNGLGWNAANNQLPAFPLGYGQTITVTEDTDVDATSATWFNTNTKPYTDTPDTPDTPDTDITVDSITAKLQNLINKANTTTGKSDTDITSGVNRLIAGYGRGGGTSYEEYNGEVVIS